MSPTAGGRVSISPSSEARALFRRRRGTAGFCEVLNLNAGRPAGPSVLSEMGVARSVSRCFWPRFLGVLGPCAGHQLRSSLLDRALETPLAVQPPSFRAGDGSPFKARIFWFRSGLLNWTSFHLLRPPSPLRLTGAAWPLPCGTPRVAWNLPTSCFRRRGWDRLARRFTSCSRHWRIRSTPPLVLD